jgi:hypothetical protein
MFRFKEVQNQNPSIGLKVFEKYCREKIISNANEAVRVEAGIQILLRELQENIFQWFLQWIECKEHSY